MWCSLAMISILSVGKGSVPVNALCSDPSIPYFSCNVWWETQFPRLYCSLALGILAQGTSAGSSQGRMIRSTGRQGALWCPWQLPQVLHGSCSGQVT